MSKSKTKVTTGGKWYGELTREYLGLGYDRSKIDMEKYRGVMPRPEGYYKEYAIGKEPPPEGHVDDTPHGRSMIDRHQVLNPGEIDGQDNLIEGFDRCDISLRHGIPFPLVRVTGLREDQVADYITEVNAARRDLDPRIRAELAKLYIARDEEAFKAGKATYRSTFNKVAVICGTSQRKVRQLERAEFPERWASACVGETRITQNGKTYEVREADPDSQIKCLLGKLGEDTPIDQQEAAIRALRETLEKHGDVLAGKDRKEIKAQVDEADRVVRERRASEERARIAAQATKEGAPDGNQKDAGEGGGNGGVGRTEESVAEVFEAIDSEPEIEDLDLRPFTAAISLYLDQRLLPRDGLTAEVEWESRVMRVAERCKLSVADVLRLLRRRPSGLEPTLLVLDRLFLASGLDPAELRDSLSKSLLMALFARAA
jgi:hypothetical protein